MAENPYWHELHWRMSQRSGGITIDIEVILANVCELRAISHSDRES